jgi:DNA-K related protein/Hsp70 protein
VSVKGEKKARYIVGIDLGTTHTVVGVCDTYRGHESEAAESAQTRPRIDVFHVPQLVAPGEVSARPLLPSFRYHPAEGELPESVRQLGFAEPSPDLPIGIVGTLAQELGRKTHGRLVASAKSWLCHPGVDREAPILPWGASDDVPKISPVEASESYLAHVRAAWNAAHPQHPLEKQDVVLTVPASFDEAARALTLRAARRAGLKDLRLLEEPQAAFYDWLDRHRDTIASELGGVRLALVVDVGGGTTDLTLIQVELRESGPRLTRIAVGEHLMLGGDNMDLTLARAAEPELTGSGEKLTAARFAQLVEQCRGVKERLLGQGSRLVGGTKSASLSLARVQELIVDGFMPSAGFDDKLLVRKSALMEFGLPYAVDPAITRHVAQFLVRHRAIAAEALEVSLDAAADDPARVMPDAILFNGGVFKSDALKHKLSSVLGALRGAALKELRNDDPELAVARGAVAYGLSRRGVGIRIGGGSARSYHLALPDTGDGDSESRGVCILPRGTEEGEELSLKQRTFMLRVGEPARFRVLTSTRDTPHRLGELVPLDDHFASLPEVAAVLEARPGDGKELAVTLHTALTEVGTLEMSFVAKDELDGGPGGPPPAAQRRYKLEFDLRGKAPGETGPRRVTQLHPRFQEAKDLIGAFFGKAAKDLDGKKIKSLRQDLEKVLGPREGWDTALARELFGALLAGKKARRRSADHERIWLHLSGYCLRPGYGYPLDPFRVEQTFALYGEGVQFAPDAQVWSQWWILWRRIAGGLDKGQQTRLFGDLAYYLEPTGPRPRKRPAGPKALGLEDMVRLAGALERIEVAKKAELGQWMWKRIDKAEVSQAAALFCIGRTGARVPLYGSLHGVVPRHVAESWLERLLALDLAKSDEAAVAAAQLARFANDRERDVSEALREKTARALERARDAAGLVRLVREGGALTEQEETRVFGESLPAGLRLLPSDE